jgi:hypothetical protein
MSRQASVRLQLKSARNSLKTRQVPLSSPPDTNLQIAATTTIATLMTLLVLMKAAE